MARMKKVPSADQIIPNPACKLFPNSIAQATLTQQQPKSQKEERARHRPTPLTHQGLSLVHQSLPHLPLQSQQDSMWDSMWESHTLLCHVILFPPPPPCTVFTVTRKGLEETVPAWSPGRGIPRVMLPTVLGVVSAQCRQSQGFTARCQPEPPGAAVDPTAGHLGSQGHILRVLTAPPASRTLLMHT